MTPRDDDRRALDILDDLEPRVDPGVSLTRRVGIRAWGRAPVVGCSGRIFQKYELADPWAGERIETPIGLGPVALRLDERQRIPQHGRMPGPATRPTSAPVPEAAAPAPPQEVAPPERPRTRPAQRPARPVAEKSQPTISERHLPPVISPRHVAVGDGVRGRARLSLKPTTVTAPRVRILDPPADKPVPPANTPPVAPDLGLPASPVPPAPPVPASPDAPVAPKRSIAPPAAMGLDDLFEAAALAGRDRRAGGRVVDPTGPRRPRVFSERPAPAEDTPGDPDQPGTVRTTTPCSKSR